MQLQILNLERCWETKLNFIGSRDYAVNYHMVSIPWTSPQRRTQFVKIGEIHINEWLYSHRNITFSYSYWLYEIWSIIPHHKISFTIVIFIYLISATTETYSLVSYHFNTVSLVEDRGIAVPLALPVRLGHVVSQSTGATLWSPCWGPLVHPNLGSGSIKIYNSKFNNISSRYCDR